MKILGFVILGMLLLPFITWGFGHYVEWMFWKLENKYEKHRGKHERH